MKLSTIKPGRILRRGSRAKRIGSGNRFIGASKFFGGKGTLGTRLRGALGRVKAAPTGLGNTIQNISQNFGGNENTVNINKIINQKVDDSLSKRGSLASQVRMPQLDGLLGSFGNIADYMRGMADPASLSAFSKGFEGINESLQDTVGVVTKVREYISKFLGDLSGVGKKLGGRNGLLGGLFTALLAGGGLYGLKKFRRVKNLVDKTKTNLTKVPTGAGNFMKGKKGKLLLGLGALGALGMGTAAYAGQGDDTVSKSEIEQITEVSGIPEEESNMFNQTVKKFQEFLDNITGGDKKKKKKPGETIGEGAKIDIDRFLDMPTPRDWDNSWQGSDNAKAAIETITQLEGTDGEGGYSRWFGDARGEMKYGDITDKTLQEVDDLQTKFLNDPQSTFTDRTGKTDKSAAVGAGQFTFLLDHARRMDPNVDFTKQKFTKEYQNKLIMFLAKEKGVDLNKPLTEADMTKLGSVWASLTPQYNQTDRTASDSLRVYQENLLKIQNQTTSQDQGQTIGEGARLSEADIQRFLERPLARDWNDTFKEISQFPPNENTEQIVNFMNLPMGDLSQNDPSNVPAPSISANNVPFLMPYDEGNLYRLGTIGNYNIISTS